MAKSKPKFNAAASITNELIRIIERGVLPWRKPWTVGGSSRPLRVSGEPYQGVNNFLLAAHPMTEPMDVPAIMFGLIPRSSNARRA